MWTYLLLNLGTILVPLIRSFEKKIYFIGNWKALLPAIIIPGTLFLLWDVWFTSMGVWGFNPRYLVGVSLFGLPLEEYLFFLTVPYACIFVYEVLNYFINKDLLGKAANGISGFIALVILIVAAFHTDRAYTSLTFFATGALLLMQLFWWRFQFMGRFLLAYFVCLVPFLTVNGVLTGTGLEEQVVWYNNAENLAIRMATIPVEDSIYFLLLFFMNVVIYEKLKVPKRSANL